VIVPRRFVSADAAHAWVHAYYNSFTKRLDKLAEIGKSAQIIPTRLTFVGIAGLVRSAAKGEGLGNQFLANIRETDAIARANEPTVMPEGSFETLHQIRDKTFVDFEGVIRPLLEDHELQFLMIRKGNLDDTKAALGKGAKDRFQTVTSGGDLAV